MSIGSSIDVRRQLGWLWVIALLAIVAASLFIARAAHGQAVDQEPDVPKKAGTCALYETHHHGNGGRSYQLTCAAPIPDSVVVYPARTK